MSNAKSGKGNPAHTRMSNKELKARRGQSWQRGKVSKDQHNRENRARAAVNATLRAEGRPTPWEVVRAARKAHRATDPVVMAKREARAARSRDALKRA
jgi:hypothetical protein